MQISKNAYASSQCVVFQRSSVIFSELVLVFALQRMAKRANGRNALLLLFSPALIIIDNIHFQYNGFLLGILILSMDLMENSPFMSAFLFASLLMFKHIFLYIAPAYIIYLFRVIVMPRPPYIQLCGSIKLAAIVLGVLVVGLGPFYATDQLPALIGRLFPFERGLCHAYWAPNFWSLYSLADRLLIKTMPQFVHNEEAIAKLTRGMVGDTSFGVLPEVTSLTTLICTLAGIAIFAIPLLLSPTYEKFLFAVVGCGYASFIYGYHVHEKAILLVIFPMAVLCRIRPDFEGTLELLMLSGYVSLFPLLFTTQGEFNALNFFLKKKKNK